MNSQSVQQVIQPIRTTETPAVLAWCGDYERYNRYPVTPHTRFSIAIYQIHQGMGWRDVNDPLNAAEGFCSAALHFCMVAEAKKLRLELALPRDLAEIPTRPFRFSAMEILARISEAQQMVYYASKVTGGIQRSSRYKPEVLEKCLNYIVTTMMSAVPSHLRSEGIYVASSIMCGKI